MGDTNINVADVLSKNLKQSSGKKLKVKTYLLLGYLDWASIPMARVGRHCQLLVLH